MPTPKLELASKAGYPLILTDGPLTVSVSGYSIGEMRSDLSKGQDVLDFTRLIIRAVNAHDDLISALGELLPLAEAYLRSAPTHPDNAKLEDARAVLTKARG